MIHVLEYLAHALKAAREGRKLSQRALGKAAGMPQYQISKIENAAVDMKASTLIALARALELEVMLVPRKHVPAVKSIVGSTGREASGSAPRRPAYVLDVEDDDG